MLVLKDEQESYYEFYVDGCDESVGHVRICEIGEIVELWSLSIHACYRCCGYGQQLVQEAIKFANGREVVLFVSRTNAVAIYLYKKCGFQIVGEAENNSWKMTHIRNNTTVADVN